MAISESFLVNPERLNPIIETLIENGEVPEKITEKELENIGFSNPSDLLVIHILKELRILASDGKPTELFEKLINPETSEKAIAEGVIHGYKDIMDKYESIYKMKAVEVKDKIDDYFGGQKTDLVLKYMANTFTKLVSFAGQKNVEEAYNNFGGAVNASAKQKKEDVKDIINGQVAKEAQMRMNGNGSASAKTIAEVKQEQKGESSIEEVLGVNGATVSEEPESEKPELPKQETKTGKTKQNSVSLNSSGKVQEAFIKKADLLYKLERFEELAPTLSVIIEKFGGADDEKLKVAVAKSVVRRAQVLAKLKRTDELLPALDEIINRFENSSNEQYYEHASAAMLNKAGLLESKNQNADLLPLYDKITDRLENASNQKIKDKVDQVYLKRMKLVLDQTDDKNLALNAVNGVIRRFKDDDNADKYLEEAMFTKASIIEKMGSDEEALEAYSEFIDRFGEKP